MLGQAFHAPPDTHALFLRKLGVPKATVIASYQVSHKMHGKSKVLHGLRTLVATLLHLSDFCTSWCSHVSYLCFMYLMLVPRACAWCLHVPDFFFRHTWCLHVPDLFFDMCLMLACVQMLGCTCVKLQMQMRSHLTAHGHLVVFDGHFAFFGHMFGKEVTSHL